MSMSVIDNNFTLTGSQDRCFTRIFVTYACFDNLILCSLSLKNYAMEMELTGDGVQM